MILSTILTPIRVAWTAENAPPSDLAIENARRLLEALGGDTSQLPDWVGRGDWPTVCLHWTSAKIEVEVYDDAYELCRFDAKDHNAITLLEYETSPQGVADLVGALEFSDQLQPG